MPKKIDHNSKKNREKLKEQLFRKYPFSGPIMYKGKPLVIKDTKFTGVLFEIPIDS